MKKLRKKRSEEEETKHKGRRKTVGEDDDDEGFMMSRRDVLRHGADGWRERAVGDIGRFRWRGGVGYDEGPAE
jgi:hypothetical protein